MASKTLFGRAQKSAPKGVRSVDSVNEAGGAAYAFSPEHGLAQYALTGTLGHTYYASDQEQMDKAIGFAQKCDPRFVAQTAIYAREKGFMKDMPAFLLAHLATRDTGLVKKSFARVVDSPKMLRNFVQILRSGQVGRKSMGSAPKKLVVDYLTGLSDDQLFRADVGQSPSLPDIIKMVHARPKTPEREALYGYLLGRPTKAQAEGKTRKVNGAEQPVPSYDPDKLVAVAKEYEEFKGKLLSLDSESDRARLEVPNVPFLLLTALPLTKEHWKGIARRASWTQTRMNLNSFARNGVFEDSQLVKLVAERLGNRELIAKAKAFPYQLFTAFHNVSGDIPQAIKLALQDAADIAIENVPTLDGYIVVCPDVSGSMSSPATGMRKGSTTKTRCIDIAALVAAAVLRKNPDARVIPFEGGVVPIHRLKLNPRDSVMTNAEKLAGIGGGSTEVSAPLRLLAQEKARVDAVWVVSDNESWVAPIARYWGGATATATMDAWSEVKNRNPNAKLVLHDIQAYGSTPAHDRADTLNLGGFSDAVFEIVSMFLKNQLDGKTLVDLIKQVEV